jgi:hypothetical protein
MALAFIPADVAARLTELTALTEVPGVRTPARGIALADGEVVTVIELGKPPPTGVAPPRYVPGEDWAVPGADRGVLCVLGGQHVALIGGTVLSTGLFDASETEDGVIWRGELVQTLDVRALYVQAEKAIWAERAVSSRPRRMASSVPAGAAGVYSPSSTALRPPPLPDVDVRLPPQPAPPTSPLLSESAPPTAPSPEWDKRNSGGSP